MVKYDAAVENSIKGNLPTRISFFYFIKFDQNPRFDLSEGSRYIVSLRREGAILRSWTDGSQLNIGVWSGSHRQTDLPLDLGAETTIAYILLTPGTDYDLDAFSRSIAWPPYSYGSPQYVYDRLTQLQRNPHRILSDSACNAIASILWIRPQCLVQAMQSPDAGTSRSAKRFWEADEVNLLARLKVSPLFNMPSRWSECSLQMFEIYAQDVRPEVRRVACQALRNLGPQSVVKACK